MRTYRRHLEARGRRQCVVLGYSDSNKEAGLCASRFAIYGAQRALAQLLAADHESHVIFHARGGSIARGGGRIDALVRSAPPEAVNGVLRLTEQGEVVQQSYGLRPLPCAPGARLQRAVAVHRPPRAPAPWHAMTPRSSPALSPSPPRRVAAPIGAWCMASLPSTNTSAT